MDSAQDSDCDGSWTDQDMCEGDVLSFFTQEPPRQLPNVLDVLNEDCWKRILDFLPMSDILKLGTVSNRWREVVCRYMQGVRLRVETISNVWDVAEQERRRQCKVLILIDDPFSMKMVLDEWGARVKELTYDAKNADNVDLLKLGENCPNLEDITFVRLNWPHTSCEWINNFKKLKRICFENSTISADCVGGFVQNNTIRELVFRMTEIVAGNLMVTVEPVNRLTAVTKLEMLHLNQVMETEQWVKFYKSVPQLEHLAVQRQGGWFTADVTAAVCQLNQLKYLRWVNDAVYTGRELDVIRKNPSRLLPPPVQELDALRVVLRQNRRVRLRRGIPGAFIPYFEINPPY